MINVYLAFLTKEVGRMLMVILGGEIRPHFVLLERTFGSDYGRDHFEPLQIIETPVHIRDLLAFIFHALGIWHRPRAPQLTDTSGPRN